MVLGSALLLALFAGIRGASQWATLQLERSVEQPTLWSEMIQLTLKGGPQAQLDPAVMPAIYARTIALIDAREQQAQARLAAHLQAHHAHLLDHSLSYVPRFADWYYSLRGEYLRFFHAAFGDLPELIAQQMIQHVLEPANTQAHIAQLNADTEALLVGELQDTFHAADRLMTRLLHTHRINLETRGTDDMLPSDANTGDHFAQQIAPLLTLSTEDLARQSVAAVAAGVAGKSMVSLLAGAAGKAGVKATGSAVAGAGTGATGGALLCGSTVIAAPLAPACAAVGGVIVGLGTWVAVDAAVLEAQEFFGREALEAEISAALTTELAQLHARLQMQYDHALQASFAELRRGFAHLFEATQTAPSRDFIPARVMGEP